METNLNPKPESQPGTRKEAITGGLLLIVAGAALLALRMVDLGQYFLVALSAAFLVVGVFTRASGWFIPAGILGGIGAGALLQFSSLPESSALGSFVLAFAAGWVSIAVLSRLFSSGQQDWALIPGGIMAAIGALLFSGTTGLAILEFAGNYWPVLPILIGLAILVKALRKP